MSVVSSWGPPRAAVAGLPRTGRPWTTTGRVAEGLRPVVGGGHGRHARGQLPRRRSRHEEETTMSERPRVVVGIDGSAESRAALQFAGSRTPPGVGRASGRSRW